MIEFLMLQDNEQDESEALQEQMQAAVQREDFTEAARLRDLLREKVGK